MSSTIFIIDSSPAVRRIVEQISAPEGFEVVGFQDVPTALEAAKKLGPHLIIADYHLDNMTFSGFCKEVQKHDTLSNTYIISLVGAADKIDESHLRGLGVNAFLKKPFQSENLLDLIKDLEQSTNRSNGAKKKSRVWPPVSSATDSDDDDTLDELSEEDSTGEHEAQAVISPPMPKDKPMAPTRTASPTAAEPEEAMKGLFGQLLQSMSEKTEKKIAELLPKMVSKDLADHVAKAVEAEMDQQLGASLTQERLTHTIEPLLAKELPNILSRELPALEPILRHSIFEIAGPLIKEHVEQLIREQTETIKDAVPDAVREHLKSIDGQVQEEIQKAAAAQTEKLAEDLVRSAAKDEVQQAVQTLVPSIAEEQIKSEIQRLTKAA